jgi:hypothetical protein
MKAVPHRVAAILGHEKLGTAAIYTIPSDKELQREVEQPAAQPSLDGDDLVLVVCIRQDRADAVIFQPFSRKVATKSRLRRFPWPSDSHHIA